MTRAAFSRKHLHAFLWAQLAYWLTLGMSIWGLTQMPRGSVRTLLILFPIVPGLLMFALTGWLYRASDEYIRLRMLAAAAVSAFVVGAFVFVYGHLELIGFQHLSMAWVHNLGWALFVIQMLRLRYSVK